MKKLYVNGTILTVDDYISSVYFDKSDEYTNLRTYRNLDSDIISIRYCPGSIIKSFPNKLFELVEPPETEVTVEGKVFARNTVTINGIEYIQPYGADYQTVSIYLLHKEPDLGVEHSRIGVYNNNLYISLLDTEYPNMAAIDYVTYLNASGLIYCKIVDESKFRVANAYAIQFNNYIYDYSDRAVLGLNKEFYVNDVSVTADFIRQMRERHPEIQFYARGEDKKQNNYNEWVNYKILPSPVKHSIWTSHVQHNAIWDRYWQGVLDIEFEYTTNDLPTLLTRRDQFRVGSFFNRDRQFSYIIDNGAGEEFDIGYTVFWERDTLDQDYGKQTASDDNNYSQFIYKYTAKLFYTNIEEGYTNRSLALVDKVIYTVLYSPPEVDIKKWDDGVYLLDTDLDFKTFLLEYSKLSTEIFEKFGTDIRVDNTCLVIDEYSTPNFYNIVNEQLIELTNNIKSIEEAATEQSNFVMVASLEQVKRLLNSYRSSLLEKLNLQNINAEVIDREETETPDDVTLTLDTEIIELPPENNNNEEENTPTEPENGNNNEGENKGDDIIEPEPDPESNNNEENTPTEPANNENEDEAEYDDPQINTFGEYFNSNMNRGLIL